MSLLHRICKILTYFTTIILPPQYPDAEKAKLIVNIRKKLRYFVPKLAIFVDKPLIKDYTSNSDLYARGAYYEN